MSADEDPQEFGPWNPGIRSDIPAEYLALSTMYRPENVATTLSEARELSDFCGLAPHLLVALRPGRLILHELLIRVTGDIHVPDGTHYGDLGINFRAIVTVLLEKYVMPHRKELNAVFERVREDGRALIEAELERGLFAGAAAIDEPEAGRSWLSWFKPGGGEAPRSARSETLEERHGRILAGWRQRAKTADDAFERACLKALTHVATAISGRHGRIAGDKDLIASLAVTVLCNGFGSEAVGDALACRVREGAKGEGYRLLSRQDKPVVLNVKGASAAGKSTMRPLQHKLTDKLQLNWNEFALISPDIWRKYLLDYDTLGSAFKYAGTLTGHELEIIDRKLDRYMTRKAAGGNMSHLLIDRFRFDSFVPETEGDDASKLLTRFGELVYMFFVVTPPHMTVERAWKRGVEYGRYKAVDDLLDHNIEAYTGMPDLFFTWASRTRKRVHYEFLDNSVDKGNRPRTIAFGWNGELNILDIKGLIDITRFTRINIDARCPADVYDPAEMMPAGNTRFLEQCVKRLPAVNFADFHTGEVYARLEAGNWVFADASRIAQVAEDADCRAGLEAIGWQAGLEISDPQNAPEPLRPDATDTLGGWGGQ